MRLNVLCSPFRYRFGLSYGDRDVIHRSRYLYNKQCILVVIKRGYIKIYERNSLDPTS
jgi:hypothetical protein